MCDAISYHYQNRNLKMHFSQSGARLPLLLRSGDVQCYPWGRRSTECHGQLPLGGWARHDAILAGKWDAYFPTSVKIPALEFMEKDIEGKPHWWQVTSGLWIQGLLAQRDSEKRLYIVTLTPEREDALFQRWPRLVSAV